MVQSAETLDAKVAAIKDFVVAFGKPRQDAWVGRERKAY
jgi:hypothetical protein